MEHSNIWIKKLVRCIDASFERLRLLTGVDFLDVDAPVFAGFDGRYFVDWMREYGDSYLSVIRRAAVKCSDDDYTLDALCYNTFALNKSVATDNPDIIYATMADVLTDVAHILERGVKADGEAWL